MKGAEHFDVIIEQLPWHLRNKVLDRLDEDGEFVEDVPEPTRKEHVKTYNKALRVLWWVSLPFVYLWCLVWVAAAVMVFFLPPIAIVLAFIGGFPGAMHLVWRVRMGVPND